MELDRPFVYISALMRTGSTTLSEALTQLPQTFIFHETHLAKNTFSLNKPDQVQLDHYGLDMRAFLRLRMPLAFVLRRLRTIWPRQDFMIKEVKGALIPRLRAIGMQQTGIKEIKHEGWKNYVSHFPGMKMVMLGRDPRDIYISAFRKWQLGTTLWHGHFTPRTVAQALNAQFTRQLKMLDHVDCLKVRYEELCTRPSEILRVLAFVESPIKEVGEVGQFLRFHPNRSHEYELHGNIISDQSVNRWQVESDKALLADAHELAALMPHFVSFWGYDV